jgi:hypothetical protein
VTSLAVNSSLSVTVAVSGSSGTPTGGVDISGGGYSSGQQTLSSGSTTRSPPLVPLLSRRATAGIAITTPTPERPRLPSTMCLRRQARTPLR